SVETSQVALYSQTGKLVWTGQAEAGRCTIPEGLSKGIYYIVIQTKEQNLQNLLLIQ
ncbi:MAG: T9SS type A sorting domain-containing protein, partial [Chitinophagaceae bacterium]